MIGTPKNFNAVLKNLQINLMIDILGLTFQSGD